MQVHFYSQEPHVHSEGQEARAVQIQDQLRHHAEYLNVLGFSPWYCAMIVRHATLMVSLELSAEPCLNREYY